MKHHLQLAEIIKHEPIMDAGSSVGRAPRKRNDTIGSDPISTGCREFDSHPASAISSEINVTKRKLTWSLITNSIAYTRRTR